MGKEASMLLKNWRPTNAGWVLVFTVTLGPLVALLCLDVLSLVLHFAIPMELARGLLVAEGGGMVMAMLFAIVKIGRIVLFK
jgi:hypothetical protein